jgi:lipase
VTGHGRRFRRLAEERLGDYRVVALDLRGHGESGYEPPWNLESHVADLAETARALGIERAAWIGFSFGGRLVSELAQAEPELVERIALLDPALQLPPDFALEAADDERADDSYSSADEAIDARLATGTLISTPREYLEEEMTQHLVEGPDGRLRARYSKSAAVAAWGEMARPPGPPAHVPTLLLLGSESHVPNDPERFGPDTPVIRLHSGHSLLWDAFAETADAVGEFLA